MCKFVFDDHSIFFFYIIPFHYNDYKITFEYYMRFGKENISGLRAIYEPAKMSSK